MFAVCFPSYNSGCFSKGLHRLENNAGLGLCKAQYRWIFVFSQEMEIGNGDLFSAVWRFALQVRQGKAVFLWHYPLSMDRTVEIPSLPFN